MEFVLAASAVATYLLKQWDTFISNFGLFAALGILLYFVIQKTIEYRFQRRLVTLKGEVDQEVQGKLITMKGEVDQEVQGKLITMKGDVDKEVQGKLITIKGEVDHEVQSKIENLKNDQQNKLESLKLDHQKVLFNFETFNSQKNERYPQLYYLAEHALGHITSLQGHRRFPNLENKAKEDVKTYCEVLEMNTGDINRILALWENDESEAISEISRLRTIIDYNRAEVKWFDANDYLIYNELYFSEEVSSQSRRFLDLMYKYWINLDPIFHNSIIIGDISNDNSVLKPQIDEQRKVWKAIMKKEVSG
ncbi:hypothetical protein OKW24_002857 [Peribacillus simplex]|uniref:hypothetical protein n=1 Tax=Peribacillus simplex TaxID=1478 RepID=UPI0024E1BB5A|nr:hypothetical protein [Peribacillus simplex]MDF9761084.1 hypothetical protein [Peribacillus simplex]